MKFRNLVIAAFLTVWAGASQAALFFLTYDSIDNGVIDVPAIVGTGTFSYDGPISEGAFLLSDLTNVSFSATFGGVNFTGPAFDPSDMSQIGIDITAFGAGVFEMVFTGGSASTAGSLDIVNNFGILSHQPGSLAGGETPPNLFFMDANGLGFFGDYLGVSSTQVPEPSSILLALLGAIGLGFSRRKLK